MTSVIRQITQKNNIVINKRFVVTRGGGWERERDRIKKSFGVMELLQPDSGGGCYKKLYMY